MKFYEKEEKTTDLHTIIIYLYMDLKLNQDVRKILKEMNEWVWPARVYVRVRLLYVYNASA